METVLLQPESDFELLQIQEFLEKTHIKSKFLANSEVDDFAEDVITDDGMGKPANWWDDEAFVKEMDDAYDKWERGEEKAFSLEEIDAEIELLRKKRNK